MIIRKKPDIEEIIITCFLGIDDEDENGYMTSILKIDDACQQIYILKKQVPAIFGEKTKTKEQLLKALYKMHSGTNLYMQSKKLNVSKTR